MSKTVKDPTSGFSPKSNTGVHDLSGQKARSAGERPGHSEYRPSPSKSANPFNGSGGSCKIISPAKVKGCN